ncbi:ABC transporter ATP-binding protein [Paraburkholderia unamae]|uniref:Amino acid/amide ABC transporter ATP-binding protein 1 (HAAT family) n=1 Tax=Paraburkholderia unamae TaxID=219649 RepID=A0ABX5KQ06_9BURK|nr:ABC transporter ATP-binding protein [Paraburkholderia unamae]PVX82755.1 amino acid/amide ABC transporter ATP-binding protein 1 (HAAT family) [Paraburkholderia unamae]RAR61310.1 amino acid/amide ABC transporter ATP-binding protein 1 (HAAT family) [Paraburkholderia unamae]CAG9269392.1 Amino acid/amide ABC transporter ATP-binding protein 1 (HAAT family) [Paraburkholderia unamae]
MSTMLRLHDVYKAFGGNQVLTGLNFNVRQGEIVGLLGPNGCGKSTVLNVITGYCPVDRGEVELQGERVSGMAAHQIAARSVRRTFQLPSMPTRMTVEEVVMAASTQSHGLWSTLWRTAAVKRLEQQTRERARHLLDELLLAKVAHLPAASLSGGQKKLLGIACAMMEQPALLLLDEPMAGVHPNLRAELVTTLKRINAQGITLVIIEHDMHFISETCSRCIVLDKGKTVADCLPSELENHESVVEAYLGKKPGGQYQVAGAIA